MNVLESPIVYKTRRNHGLEHATIHVLTEHIGLRSMAGYSTPAGFFILGDLTTESIRSAVDEALQRMQGGQRHLAVHHGCGTNHATSGILAGTLALFTAWFGSKRQSRWEQISNASMAAMIGIVVGQALGKWLQANVTTSGDMRGVSVKRISKIAESPTRVHFVETATNQPTLR